jgi:tetratricopeptide (TPR) repeat protein
MLKGELFFGPPGRAIVMKKTTSPQANGWLEQAFPQVHHLLLALEGDRKSLEWLKVSSKGVSLLVRALGGKGKALAAFHAEEPADMDDLFELIDNDDLSDLLSERQPDLQRLFSAIKGEEPAMSELKQTKPSLARLGVVVRELYESWRKQQNGAQPIDNGSAADMGCLIGEMHLKAGDYQHAIEAFTRAIASKPEADLFEGRARAYRALAAADEIRAEEMNRQR